MSTEFQDVGTGLSSPPPPPADSAGVGSSPTAQEGSSDVPSPLVGDVNAGANIQDNSGSETKQGDSTLPPATVDPLEGIPSVAELRAQAEQKVPYAEGLLRVREAYEASKTKVSELEPLSAFSSVVQNSTPEQLKAKLEIVDGFFSPVLRDGQQVYENGVPVTTATPGLERLLQESPDTLFQIINDALPLQVNGRTMEDLLADFLLQKRGLDPADLPQYAEWKRTGAPVATAAADLSEIPQQYHEVFKSLPEPVRQDIVNADPAAREHYLKREQQAFEGERARQEAAQNQAREAQATVQRNTQTAIQGKLDTGVDQFLQHLSGWKPTADDAVNRAYHLETASSLLNLLDPGMARVNQMLYETLGMQPDAEIPQLNQQFQQQTGLVELYKARGDQLNAANAQRSADSAYMRLVAKLNGVAGKLIEHKSRAAKVAEAAAAADGQQGRGHVQGQPGALAANGGRSGSWTAAFYD